MSRRLLHRIVRLISKSFVSSPPFLPALSSCNVVADSLSIVPVARFQHLKVLKLTGVTFDNDRRIGDRTITFPSLISLDLTQIEWNDSGSNATGATDPTPPFPSFAFPSLKKCSIHNNYDANGLHPSLIAALASGCANFSHLTFSSVKLTLVQHFTDQAKSLDLLSISCYESDSVQNARSLFESIAPLEVVELLYYDETDEYTSHLNGDRDWTREFDILQALKPLCQSRQVGSIKKLGVCVCEIGSDPGDFGDVRDSEEHLARWERTRTDLQQDCRVAGIDIISGRRRKDRVRNSNDAPDYLRRSELMWKD